MIEASVRALAGLVPVFMVLAGIVAVPAVLFARAKRLPATATALWAVCLAGVSAVTLLPRAGGVGPASGESLVCDTGSSLRGMLSTTSGQLNVLLLVPLCFFAVLAFRRPLAALAGGLLLTGTVELAQAALPIGRACSYDDLIANSLGTAAGVLLGLGWTWARSRRHPFTRRDTLRGGGVLVAGAVALGAAFHFAVTPVDGLSGPVAPTSEQERWAVGVAQDFHGEDVEIVDIDLMEAVGETPARLFVATGRGTLSLVWPDREVRQVDFDFDGIAQDGGSAAENQAPREELPPAELRRIAERLALKWFPEETAGGEASFGPTDEEDGSHRLAYRDPADGAGSAVRLSITIAPSGRLTDVTVR